MHQYVPYWVSLASALGAKHKLVHDQFCTSFVSKDGMVKMCTKHKHKDRVADVVGLGAHVIKASHKRAKMHAAKLRDEALADPAIQGPMDDVASAPAPASTPAPAPAPALASSILLTNSQLWEMRNQAATDRLAASLAEAAASLVPRCDDVEEP